MMLGSALFFDGDVMPREASTKDLQTYTGGVVRFYLVPKPYLAQS